MEKLISTLRRLRTSAKFAASGFWPRVEGKFNKKLHGSSYGCWCVIEDLIGKDSIVYSFGIGTDISFDLSLIESFGCTIHGFDPTPKSVEWINRHSSLPAEFHFHNVGISDFDGALNLQPPENQDHASFSIARSDTSVATLEFPVKRLTTFMAELEHNQIDVLKIDIEGSEYGVLSDLAKSGVRPKQLLIEFHPWLADDGIRSTKNSIEDLLELGYKVFHISDSGNEFSLVFAADD